jgi:pimeloyl-ACP methyl ester carboxylesterase
MIGKKIIINDLSVEYYQSSNLEKNNTLVFLHGWGSEASHLRNIFGKYSNFVAVDLPGFGKSELPKSAWSMVDYANFLKVFLNKLEIKNPILIGHSFGGSIIIKYLSKKNDTRKAILVSPSGVRKKEARVFIWKILAKIANVIILLPGLNKFKDAWRRKFYKAIDSEDYIEAGKLTESYKKIIREDLKEDMGKINTETILIWGESDKATPLEQGMTIQKLIKNSRLYVIKNAGHFSFIDQPEEFNKIFQKEINAN